MKLADPEAGFHGVFLANKIDITTALQLAELSPQSQQKNYEEHFEAWEDEDFDVPDYLETVIEIYGLTFMKQISASVPNPLSPKRVHVLTVVIIALFLLRFFLNLLKKVFVPTFPAMNKRLWLIIVIFLLGVWRKKTQP